jgi:hypothetical protein
MKSLGGSGEMVTSGTITPVEGLRYAMSLKLAKKPPISKRLLVSESAKKVTKYAKVHQSGVEKAKSAKVTRKKSNKLQQTTV